MKVRGQTTDFSKKENQVECIESNKNKEKELILENKKKEGITTESTSNNISNHETKDSSEIKKVQFSNDKEECLSYENEKSTKKCNKKTNIFSNYYKKFNIDLEEEEEEEDEEDEEEHFENKDLEEEESEYDGIYLGEVMGKKENNIFSYNDYKLKFEKEDKTEPIEKKECTFMDESEQNTGVMLSEEEIKKILLDNDDEWKEDKVVNKEIANNKTGKNRITEKDLQMDLKKAYEESVKNYQSKSFVDMLNADCDQKINQIDEQENTNNEIQKPDPGYIKKNFREILETNQVCFMSCMLCGEKIKANTSKMCNNCLIQNIEANTANLNKDTYLIYYCRECFRYLHNRWVFCELESKELLALCLKKVSKLKKIKIKNAKFLYTEPHSKRLKIMLSIEEELINNFISEMEIILHFKIKYTQCDDCKKKYTPHTYNTCVSVRQKVDHKKTLLFLESLILKTDLSNSIINIVNIPDGLDFHFSSRTDGLKFCEFIASKTISKCKSSKHLINHDAKNNTYNYKYSFALDICPVCKYDLIFFSKEMSLKYGVKSSFYLCFHVSIFILLINPFSITNSIYISQERYHKFPFSPLLSRADAKTFLILNVEFLEEQPIHFGSRFSVTSSNKNCVNSASSVISGVKRRKQRKTDMGGKEKGKTKRMRKSYQEIEPLAQDEVSDYETILETNADNKSCKSSTRRVKLDKLVYAYVELLDESNGTTVLTKTFNAKHLKPGDYVHVYDLRTHCFSDEINFFLEKDNNYGIIIIDKVKVKEKRKIENEIEVQNNNISTMKKVNEVTSFEKLLSENCEDINKVQLN